MARYDGINVLSGIIPIPDHYDITHKATKINTVFVIDHYALPGKSAPDKKHRIKGPVIPAVGSLYTSGGALPYKPSYAKITNETVLSDPVNYEIKHKIEIIDNSVIFNGALLIRAPDKHNNGKKFTAAQKLQFCKAVIFSIIPGEIKRPIKDHPSKCTVYESVPDDEYFRELIALYPAVPVNLEVVPAVPEVILPDALNAYTPEAITGCPGADVAADIVFMASLNDDVDRDNLESLLREELFDDMGSPYDSLSLESEYNKGEEKELYDLLYPVQFPPVNAIRSWSIPHLNVSICEVSTA